MPRLIFSLIVLVSLSACTNVFLQPDKVDYGAPVRESAIIDEGFFPTTDGLQLHYWLIPAQQKNKVTDAKGLIIQMHGNAQNLTSHVRNAGWLTAAGYNLFIFDYRGYGRSGGSKSIDGAFQDVQAALDFATKEKNPRGLPVFLYGQSLGGSLGLKAVSKEPRRWPLSGVIIEGSFVSYRQIAREKLALWWLTWPLQWLGYVFVSGEYSLDEQQLKAVSPTPVWLFYSKNDPIVPYHNGPDILKMLNDPKELFDYPEFGHVNAMWVQNGKFREVLLKKLSESAQKKNL